MKIVVSPDSFKGSLGASEVAGALARGLAAVAPTASIIEHPLSDGGEGTLDVLSGAGFELHTADVVDSFGAPLTARFASRGNHVVIESAEAFRFQPRATPEQALQASSYGVGLLIRAALDIEPATITLTVGGTSGTDGGAGMLQALGFGLLDHTGQQIGRGGGKLASLHSVDTAMLDPRIAEVDFQVVTDVTNPLLGERGAAAVFAPQKGASASAIEALEAGLTRFARLLDSKRAAEPGTGAGGGLAYGAMVGLGATLRSGARWMMTLTQWESVIEGADLIITGEGSFDQQSLEGKITGVVIQQATAQSVPVVVVCGVNHLQKLPAGVSVIPLSDLAQDTESSFARAAELLEHVGRQIADAI